MSQGRGYRRREEEKQIPWVPRTKLGSMVAEGKITSLEEIFQQGWKIREPEMVKKLVPDLTSEVVYVGIVQKQTDAGELTRFGAVVAVGNGNGWFGVGKGKAAQMKSAIDKATNDALLNIIPVKLGCGSWECKCGTTHSVPYRISGQGGERDGGAPPGAALARKGRGPRPDEPPGARWRQGRLGQDLRLDQHALVARQRGLRRVLKVARAECIGVIGERNGQASRREPPRADKRPPRHEGDPHPAGDREALRRHGRRGRPGLDGARSTSARTTSPGRRSTPSSSPRSSSRGGG